MPGQGEAQQGRGTEGVLLTCLKQRQKQQQAGAHGQIAPTLGYSGDQLPALRQCLAVLPSEPRCGCAKQACRAAAPGFIYSWLCARLQWNTLSCDAPEPQRGPVRPRCGSTGRGLALFAQHRLWQGGRGCCKGIRSVGSGTAQDPGTKPGSFKLFAYRPWLTSEKLRQSEALNQAFCGLGSLLWYSLGKDFLLL